MRTRRVRRISVSVRPPSKVRLTIPYSCSLQEGLDFLREKEQWIADTLKKVALKNPVGIIEPGYRTTRRSLVFEPAGDERITAILSRDRIAVTVPKGMDYRSAEVQDVARKALIHALKGEGKEVLPGLVEELARRHGFRYGKVTVRATTSRWGSCSPDNNISLSVFLMCIPVHLRDYVILHELCHTRHKDHSPRFHALLDSLLGGREKQLSAELRKYQTDVVQPGALSAEQSGGEEAY